MSSWCVLFGVIGICTSKVLVFYRLLTILILINRGATKAIDYILANGIQ